MSAGKELSSVIYAKMKNSPEYKRELAAARAEAKANRGKSCVGHFTPVKTHAVVGQH
ncbi:MAG: hypothetical protein WDN72_07755 [Alphaproteobacteria bacterium]